MKRTVRHPKGAPHAGLTASYQVSFSTRLSSGGRGNPPEPVGRLPRVTSLLAVAHRIDGMIRAGEIRDWADAARLVGVTRARMTQIANLTLLAPAIQVVLLHLDLIRGGPEPVTERKLRGLLAHPDWATQVDTFHATFA